MTELAEFPPEVLMAADACCWASRNQIKLMGNTTFTLNKCGYMQDIMTDPARHRVVMKGAQARITTLFMLESIHALIYNRFPQGVIYYFPSRDAVEDFSKTRFGPLIQDNPCIKKFLKSTDSVFAKKVGKAFLTLKGATATKVLKGRKKDSASVRSTPADMVIRDERDLFDNTMVEMTTDRLLNSTFKKEVDLGTPTMPDFGIDKEFQRSDQKYWLIKCGHCNQYTCIATDFPNSIRYKDGKPYYACVKCEREIFISDGGFVAKHPDRSISGYHVSHFITPNCDLGLVMEKWKECQLDGSKLGTFYNSRLGIPYIAAEDRLTESDVFACCGHDVMRTDLSLTETAMGADIGKHYHTVVIGQKVDKDRAKIIYMARVKGFSALYDIAMKYKVKSAVIDIRPYEEEFNNFKDAHSSKFRIFGAEYKDKQKVFMKTDEKAGIYSLLRTQTFDKSHAWIKSRMVEIPRKCEEVNEFARQMCNCAKTLEETEEGDRLYRYIKMGDDHYRSAVNYLMVALQDLTHSQGMSTAGYVKQGKSYDPLNWGL